MEHQAQAKRRRPDKTELARLRLEVHKCRRSFAYFCDTYCRVLSDIEGPAAKWVPFHLWPAQFKVARALQENRLLVVLKARQLGLSWLVLAFGLWLILFHPIATVLLFSRRDDEATDLLSVRLRGMYLELPEWLRCRAITTDNDHEFVLSNGSRALAFPTTAGDSYTASLAICDEFDLVDDENQRRLMRAVKPTIDGGGRMVLVSRSDKKKPQSMFKRVYLAAKQKLTAWVSIFLPWHVRPGRDAAWYAAQRADVLHRTQSLDDLHEQYPATDAEALSPRTLDKRIPAEWLERCYQERAALPLPPGAPPIPGLEIYVLPQRGRIYVAGIDTAEGNPTSDPSAITLLDAESGEEVASLAARLQPAVQASYADQLGRWYNRAALMVERNNHGHAVLLWLAQNSSLIRLEGRDGRDGWLSSTLGKVQLYDAGADALRNTEVTIHSLATFAQLASIEGSTLRAPDGEHDDLADSYVLACVGRLKVLAGRGPIGVGEPGRRNVVERAPAGVFNDDKRR